MTTVSCRVERTLRFVVVAVLLAVAAGFLALGLSVLPVTGIVLALPPLVTAVLFMAAPLSRACMHLAGRRR
jgi:hypothetical protein